MPEYSEFSEFSYGYALVDNLARSGGWGGLAGAPRFISLSEEGSTGGGFDVALDFVAWPFFLQFKIPQIMRRRSAGMPMGFVPPYYRMHLRTERVNASGSTQHEQLMALEGASPLSVFYVAPRFHTVERLDDHYRNGRVHERSEWFPLSGFDPANPLTREPHRIAYGKSSSMCVVQSNPIPFRKRMSFEDITEIVRGRFSGLRPHNPETWLEQLEHITTATIEGKRAVWVEDFAEQPEPGQPRPRFLNDGPKAEFHRRLQVLAKSVRTRLDAELVLAIREATPLNAQ